MAAVIDQSVEIMSISTFQFKMGIVLFCVKKVYLRISPILQWNV